MKSGTTVTVTVSRLTQLPVKSLTTSYTVVIVGDAVGLEQGVQLKFVPTFKGSPLTTDQSNTEPLKTSNWVS